MTKLEESLEVFFKEHLNPGQPILLALSGGVDSLTLFHLLLDYRKKSFLDLHVAHVDHGWRKESSEEAVWLKNYVESYGIPFHVKTLASNHDKTNLEAICREARLTFFKELSRRYFFQAVLLGHHADDLAETVLKRVLEGASLLRLEPLKPVIHFDQLILWRPFLCVRKKELEAFVEAKGLHVIEDATNQDMHYLRNRIRHELLPTLKRAFGKEIAPPLIRLSQESHEFAEYLDQKIQHFDRVKLEGPLGVVFDFSSLSPHRVELKYFIRRLLAQRNKSITQPFLTSLCKNLLSKVANCHLFTSEHCWIVDRGRLFLLNIPELPSLEKMRPLRLEEGQEFDYGFWRVKVSRSETGVAPQSTWKSCWQGECKVVLPSGEYILAMASEEAEEQAKLQKLWTASKAPAFLRARLPVIWKGGHIEREFLSGKKVIKRLDPIPEGNSWLEVKLTIVKECL